MIVLGDRRARVATRALLAELAAARDPLERLLLAGELWQGLADAAFAARGERDDAGDLERACARLAFAAARAWLPSLSPPPPSPPSVTREERAFARALSSLAARPLPPALTITRPEGYAHFALQPGLFADAATALAPPVVVIGLRSIGTSLAAVVAAVAGDALALYSVRPTGPPFDRRLALTASLARELAAQPAAARFAIVDEGPGLSGSSFCAAADALEAAGVAPERLCFLASHDGPPGPQALPRHRQRWSRTPRLVGRYTPAVLRARELLDVSEGRWRAALGLAEPDWPPADAARERRKFLLREPGRVRLAKFAGLGRYGAHTLEAARRLAAAGLHPQVHELRDGYLVMDFHPEARPLDLARPYDRPALLAALGRYLSLRARALGPVAAGASLAELWSMARHNVERALGPARAGALVPLGAHLPQLERERRPGFTDGRLHAWEWLALPDGRWLKVDGLDHAFGPDLVGPQDLAWDLAGAAVELRLSPAEEQALLGQLDRAPPSPRSLRFHRLCYLAFQLGAFTLAQSSTSDAAERERLGRERARYLGLLSGDCLRACGEGISR